MKKRMKNLLIAALCIVMALGTLAPASAATAYDEPINALCQNINALVVYDITENRVLFGKNEKQQISVASTTKLLTSLVTLSVFGPEEIITVGQEIDLRKPNSSVSLIQPGHQLTVRTLIAALLLPSGNDAAYTAAVNTARKHSKNSNMPYEEAVTYFCGLMCEYAKKLGCKKSNFVNPEGWDDDNHYSTASDMTKIAVAALKNEVIASISNIHYSRFDFQSGEWIDWYNTNELLNPESEYYYEYAHGMKTGTTYAAGKCLIAYAEKDGHEILIAAFGCAEEADRFGRIRDIFECVFALPSLGDIDENGVIDASDARVLLRAAVGLEKITPVLKARGDIDNDGALTSFDARTVLRAAVGIESI